MVVPQILSVVLYGAAVAGDHPDIDAPENLSKFSGFIRIGAIILLLIGLVTALGNLSGSALGATAFAFLVVMVLGLYDYTIMAKKKRKAAKDTVAKAGKEYLETKKEVEKGPDQVTNVQGDMVDRKDQQTHVDRSTTNVDTIDQSTTRVDQSKTVKDQRTQVEDSVVNRSDITASAEGGTEHGNRGGQPRTEQREQGGHQPQNGRRPQDEPQAPHTDQGNQRPADNGQSGGGRPRSDRHSQSEPRPQGSRQEQGSAETGGSSGGAQYCPSCGESVDANWNTCISCGSDL
ncbi:zinc ribbon domain-containing protein [Haloplanus pelagicus]|uniref:zinc ribbon domain-containing protein n=1 Tax=Haloplanus pelagicus TaxID=2949995 RepID=UPI00203FF341|nr:zinc ribbon domain-containing protein [Haloplanus sp. HW8-1]